MGTCPEWAGNIQCVLFDSTEIRAKVSELAAAISRHYSGRPILCVGLLTGAFIFLSDLVRQLTIPYQVDFVIISSYGRSNALHTTPERSCCSRLVSSPPLSCSCPSSVASTSPPPWCQWHHLHRLRQTEEGSEPRSVTATHRYTASRSRSLTSPL